MVSKNSLEVSKTVITKRNFRYLEFWGRDPDFILHPTEHINPHIDIYRFPPKKVKWFFQKSPIYNQYVYMSAGMSDADMPVKTAVDIIPSRIELTAFSNEIYKNQSGDMDMIAWWLSFLAHLPFRSGNTFFAPGHTFTTKEAIIPDSKMTGFFFGVTPSVDLKNLCSASINAKLILQVVPISDSERKLAEQKGSNCLVDYFEKHNIEPMFDLRREPFI
ncbi:MAG: suppressor of fused domain protein [Candidatus Omnitrophota bacterium]